VTRYQQLAEALGAEIEEGRIGVGDLLPTEAALALQFDVSRHTVREALRVLREQGLITSRQGMGSRVRSCSPRVAYVEAVTSIDDLLEYAAATRLEQTKREDVIADEALADRLRCQPARRWVRITGLRFANDAEAMPICQVEIYLDPALADGASPDSSAAPGLFGKLEAELRQNVEVHQEIAVATIPCSYARALGVEPDSEALRVVRTYVDRDGRTFMVSINLHPADRYTHRTVLVRRSA
jgi:DNA-binding GntR family transcriptional regulator